MVTLGNTPLIGSSEIQTGTGFLSVLEQQGLQLHVFHEKTEAPAALPGLS